MAASSAELDELVAAFASQHIGQHNIDLAKVRDQLAQLLFFQANMHQANAQPHNTPTTRTTMPTNWLPEPRKRSASIASLTMGTDQSIAEEDDDGMDADHDQPFPQSSQYYNPPNSPQRPSAPGAFFSSATHHASGSQPQSPSTSFALADPFFAATLENATSSFSGFSHQMTPGTSPFFVREHEQRPPLTIDTRSRMISPVQDGNRRDPAC